MSQPILRSISSTEDYDNLVAKNLEVGTRFDMKYIEFPSGNLYACEAVYEGLSTNDEVDELTALGKLSILTMDSMRETHHLVWIDNELWLNDFIHLNFLSDLDHDIIVRPLAQES